MQVRMWLGLVALTVTAWAAPALADHAQADASDWKPRTTAGTAPNLSSSARAPKPEGDLHAWAGRAALLWLLSIRQAGIAPAVHQSATLPAGVPLAQFWTPPADLASRDLFLGPALTPAPDATRPLEFVSKKRTGFSAGYDVTDASGREWSVKLGPEAQTEVVASRLVWAAGYHQPPTFYVSRWTLAGGPSPGVQDGARFRPKAPLVSRGSWSWQQNPFVGSQPYRGLVVLMLLLNSTDLRNENNVVYELPQGHTSDRWYVVKDLGATFGETGIHRPRRNDLESFAHAPFLTIDGEGHQRFAYRGLYKELLGQITDEDVRWASSRLAHLSDAQWHDAFRAGGYTSDVADGFITLLRARIEAGLHISDVQVGARSDYWATRQRRRVAGVVRATPGFVAHQVTRVIPVR